MHGGVLFAVMGSRVNGGLVVASGNVLYTRRVILGTRVAHNKIVLLKVPDYNISYCNFVSYRFSLQRRMSFSNCIEKNILFRLLLIIITYTFYSKPTNGRIDTSFINPKPIYFH